MCARSEAFHYCTTHGLALIVSVTCLKYNGSECYYSLMTMTVDMSTLFQWIGASICWSNTTDYIVKLLLQLTCCVVDKLGRWWLRVKKCCIMSVRNHCIYTQIVWRVTSNTYSTVRTITNMCLHYIWVEVPATCAHSSDGSCKVHARLQHSPSLCCT